MMAADGYNSSVPRGELRSPHHPVQEEFLMPTLILEHVPPTIYERIQRRAAANNQPVPVEVLCMLEQVLADEEVVGQVKDRPLRLPDPPFLTEEMPAPFDLPRPGEGKIVEAEPGGVRLPDPPLLLEDLR
jgi:hypothetical protein